MAEPETHPNDPGDKKQQERGSPRAIDPARESAGLAGGQPSQQHDRRVDGVDPARESAGVEPD